MKLLRPQPSNKAKPVFIAVAGALLLLVLYVVFSIDTSAPAHEIRKELTLNELQ